jgi:hypothetical protein
VFEQRFSFLQKMYRPPCRPWEALLCLQTVTLVAVNQFARKLGALCQLVSGSSTQLRFGRQLPHEHADDAHVAR